MKSALIIHVCVILSCNQLIGFAFGIEERLAINPKKTFKREVESASFKDDAADKREGKDYNRNWSFLNDNLGHLQPSNNNIMAKPLLPFPFGRPKPSPISENASPSGDDKMGWTSSVGWSSILPSCSDQTSTSTVTSTSTSIQVLTSTTISTSTVSSTELEYGWTVITETEWDVSTTTEEVTTTSIIYETSTIPTTSTQIETSKTTETYTLINTETSITYETSTLYDYFTSTTFTGWTGDVSTDSIVLEPTVEIDYTTSTLTIFITETPTMTTHIPVERTVTTGLEVVVETVYSQMSSTPPITVTEFVPTSSEITVDTVTSTTLTRSPKCTVTETEYLSTLTTPTLTYTATQCGYPCAAGEKCVPICFPKTMTKVIEVTSTSIVTAPQPMLVKYTATETTTEFNVSPEVLSTTTTVESFAEPEETTITASFTPSPISIKTLTVDSFITELPTTITTTENLCTLTILETCTSTTTTDPTYVTLYDTVLIGVDETVTMQTTSFTAPPIPTVTSFVQGNVNSKTVTIMEVKVTNTDPTTMTVTSDATTVGSGYTTVTPTTTFVRTKTAVITSTPVESTTSIKTRTLKVEEFTTDTSEVEEVTEYYTITPTYTNLEVVEVTPTPSVVFATNLVMEFVSGPPSPPGGWVGWKGL